MKENIVITEELEKKYSTSRTVYDKAKYAWVERTDEEFHAAIREAVYREAALKADLESVLVDGRAHEAQTVADEATRLMAKAVTLMESMVEDGTLKYMDTLWRLNVEHGDMLLADLGHREYSSWRAHSELQRASDGYGIGWYTSSDTQDC